MQARLLGSTDLRVSTFAMGCNKLGSIAARQTERSAVRLVHAAVDAGIQLFDTADSYGAGSSEKVLGRALRGNSSAIVATKVGYRYTERARGTRLALAALTEAWSALPGQRSRSSTYVAKEFSPSYVRAAVDASLSRLRRERIDLLQFHGPPPAESSDLPMIVSELLAAGKVRYFGVGCETLASAESWARVAGVSAIQLPFGILDPAPAGQLIPEMRRAGLGVLARGILGGGIIARYLRGQDAGIEDARVRRLERLRALGSARSVDIAQLAVWYAQYGADVDVLVIGISNESQLQATRRFAAAGRPDNALLAELQAIAADRLTS